MESSRWDVALFFGNRKCTKTLSKAPCLVALNMYLTLHLLLLGQLKQSMRGLIEFYQIPNLFEKNVFNDSTNI